MENILLVAFIILLIWAAILKFNYNFSVFVTDEEETYTRSFKTLKEARTFAMSIEEECTHYLIRDKLDTVISSYHKGWDK